MAKRVSEVNAIGGETPTNGAERTIEMVKPYFATVTIEGTADFLFHRWNCESVQAKADASKGSKAKKTDDVESYVYRNDDGELCIPGEYLRMSVVHAAKFRQDPRSPRKSAMDLFKAGIVGMTPLATLGKTNWDYLHQCRVVIQRNAVTRSRPAIKAGYQVEMQFMINLPEYISPQMFNDTIASAGKLIGIGDFRPSYGRFQVVSFDIGFE